MPRFPCPTSRWTAVRLRTTSSCNSRPISSASRCCARKWPTPLRAGPPSSRGLRSDTGRTRTISGMPSPSTARSARRLTAQPRIGYTRAGVGGGPCPRLGRARIGQGMPFEAATQRTMYFIGVTTGRSSIMKVFPAWSDHLGLGAVMRGIDFLPTRSRALSRGRFVYQERSALAGRAGDHAQGQSPQGFARAIR